VITKDRDFINLLGHHGPPPQVIWLRTDNSSNEALQITLKSTLAGALELLSGGEPWVPMRPR